MINRSVSFEMARQIVRQKIFAANKDLIVAQWGWENQEWWSLMVGFHEYVVGFDASYAIDSDVVYLVHKSSGEYREVNAIAETELLATFQPFGDVPTYFQDD